MAWLLLVVYPVLTPLGTYPIAVGTRTVSVEFCLALICVATTIPLAFSRRIFLYPWSLPFSIGVLLWIAANIFSAVFNESDGADQVITQILMKAGFGYVAFLALRNSPPKSENVAYKYYVAGCAVAGLFAIAFCVYTGNLEELRQASYMGSDVQQSQVSLFSGLARAGAGNLLPLWIIVAFYPSTRSLEGRVVMVAAAVYFVVLSLLALRREVLIEGIVGFVVLLFFIPRRYRLSAAGLAIAFSACIAIVLSQSERWQERLFGETRTEFSDLEDPRLVLLMNTPAETALSPVYGHGPGTYPQRMTKYLGIRAYRSLQAEGLNEIAPHNSFSRAAVESGLLGLAGIVMMMVAVGRVSVFGVRAAHNLYGINLIAPVLIFVHLGDLLFFGDGISLNSTWYLLGLLLGLERSAK